MMAPARLPLALLAAIATLFAIAPATSLFDSSSWFVTAATVVAIVCGSGMLARLVVRGRPVIPLVQLVAGLGFILWRFPPSLSPEQDWTDLHLAWASTWGELFQGAIATISKHSAPAPMGEGIALALVLITLVVAVIVDGFAVTWLAPAAAGLPLLTAYLITAANGSDALALTSFAPPVLVWLTMVHLTSRRQVVQWPTIESHAGTPPDAQTPAPGSQASSGDTRGDTRVRWRQRRSLGTLATTAVAVAVVGIAAAVVTAALTPHFPPRYIADGLGRSESGGTSGTVGFSDTIDLARSLRDTNDNPLFEYTTGGSTRLPMRVLATSYYSRGQWMVGRIQRDEPTNPAPLPDTGSRREYTVSVFNNTLAAPRVAAPFPVISAEVDSATTTVSLDPVTRDIQVSAPVASYRATYVDTVPLASQIREWEDRPVGADVIADDYIVPDRIAPNIRSWAQEVAGSKASKLDKAIAIQDHLRDTSIYTYTLTLPDPPATGPERFDPLLAFRQNKQGYCVQFASAMIMLARAEGIPARMAIGFLPGTFINGRMVVRASDAHAWPELYFNGVGWLRFEPTPGARSGQPPPWATTGSAGPTAGGQGVDEEPSATATPTATTTVAVPGAASTEPGVIEQVLAWFTPRTVIAVGILLLAVLLVFLMPITAWALDRRRRRSAVTQQDLVEIEWERLVSQLRDLGVDPPPGGTLRAVRDHYEHEAHLDTDAKARLGRVTATLERARYQPPERLSSDDTHTATRDIRGIGASVRRTRARMSRARAFFLPDRALAWWRARLRR